MFNKDFIWGCATASYQIEGAAFEDGKEKSIWDTFCEQPNVIANEENGLIACDSYHKYKEDITLLKELGVKAYRFSISWSRVLFSNDTVNEKGLGFYVNFAKELKEAGIEPYVTLYHWDMPQYIQDRGGLLNRDFADWFSYYTDIVTKALAPYVKNWITINEPQCIINHGHRLGVHAPGLKLTEKELLAAIHHLLLAHGLAVRVIRKNVKDSTVGIAPCCRGVVPIKEDEKLYKKCYERFFKMNNDVDFTNRVAVYSDPVFLGDYPKEYYELFKDILPNIQPKDMEIISTPTDYLYQNMYSGDYYDLDENGELIKMPRKQGYAQVDVGWLQLVPGTIQYSVRYLYERYKKPVIISENGCCTHDWIFKDGKVHDLNRIDFMERYLEQLEIASKYADIRGFFYWSLLDNFEWSYGYQKRFGLVFVDYENDCKRIPKDSFYHYKKIIKGE